MEWPSTKFGKIVKGASLWQKSISSSPSFISSTFQIYFRSAFLLSPLPLINYLSFFFLDICHSLLNGLSVSFLSPYYQLLSRKWIQSCKNVNASTHSLHKVLPMVYIHLLKLKCIPVYNISLISLLTNLQLQWSFLSSSWLVHSFPTPLYTSYPTSHSDTASPRTYAQAIPSSWKTFHMIDAFLVFASQPQKSLFFVLCLNKLPFSLLSCLVSMFISYHNLSFGISVCLPLFLFNL